MKLISLLIFSFLTINLFAQCAGVCNTPACISKMTSGNNNRVAPSSAYIKIIPNPVTDGMLHIQAVGLDIFAANVYTSAGDIVEIDNLSGRGDINLIALPPVLPGIYFAYFDTSVGFIVKKFIVS